MIEIFKSVGLKSISKNIRISEKSKLLLEMVKKRGWQISDSDIISNDLELQYTILLKLDIIDKLLGLDSNKNNTPEKNVKLYRTKQYGKQIEPQTFHLNHNQTLEIQEILSIEKSSAFAQGFKYYIASYTGIKEIKRTTTDIGFGQVQSFPTFANNPDKSWYCSDMHIQNDYALINHLWEFLLEARFNKDEVGPSNKELIPDFY